jgi:hypothetical protein
VPLLIGAKEDDNDQNAGAQEPSQANKRKNTQATLDGVVSRSSMKSTVALEIDNALANWIFIKGLPLSILQDGELQRIVALANPGYTTLSSLNATNLKSTFLPQHFRATQQQTHEMLAKAPARCILMDGWSGVQRRHAINLLITTPTPYFIKNVYTGESKVTAEYQYSLIHEHIFSMELPIAAICSDFASTMTATWRILRQNHPGILTLGCACHGFQLLGRDIMLEPTFSKVLGEAISVVKYFRSHLRLNGLASLIKFREEISKRLKELALPAPTRWNSHLICAESLIQNRTPLYSLVTSEPWLVGMNAQMREISDIILRADFWSSLQHYTRAAAPIRDCIMALQRDDAVLSDIYNCMLYLSASFSTLPVADQYCTTVFQKRFLFMIHPAHLAAYLLDNRYMKVSHVKSTHADTCLEAILRYIMPQLDDAIVTAEVASFTTTISLCVVGTPTDFDWLSANRSTLKPLHWWTAAKDVWPNLHRVALILFNLPCSASAAERVWSSADYIISKRRARLGTSTSDQLLSIFWNSKSLNTQAAKDPPKRIKPQDCTMPLPQVPLTLVMHTTTASVNEATYPESFYADDGLEDDLIQGNLADGAADPVIIIYFVAQIYPSTHTTCTLFQTEETIEDNDQVCPIATDRQFNLPILPFEDVELREGVAIALWYSSASPAGWYNGTLGDFDNVTTKWQINFCDNSFDDVKLQRRSYGQSKLWVVQVPTVVEEANVTCLD